MKQRRGISAGTVLMTAMTVICTAAFLIVSGRLAGHGADLSRLRVPAAESAEAAGQEEAPDGSAAENTETAGNEPQLSLQSAAEAQSTTAPEENTSAGRTLTITFGGTAAVEDAVRKSCYSSDSRKYDFSLVMNLLQPCFRGDAGCVFLENVLSGTEKVSATVAPAEAAEMLHEAGVTLAAAGYANAYDKGAGGVDTTRRALIADGVTPLGIRAAETEDTGTLIRNNGTAVALLQYTAGVSSSARNKMAKQGVDAVPVADAERIRADIRAAREQGAGAVAVLVSWGKVGNKSPDKNQKALARQIAEAGADLIIGAGSRVPQAPERIAVTGEDGKTREVLCCYSLGTLVSDNRKNISRMSGYLLRVTFRTEGDGSTVISGMGYIPTYLWRYKQDGTYYYRCLAANRTPPDGMDSDQQTNMAKAAENVAGILKDSGIRILEQP